LSEGRAKSGCKVVKGEIIKERHLIRAGLPRLEYV
jgi:hypothetical protein